MASQTINFTTWNVNGLKRQRDQKFQKLQNADVVFLQETHIGVGDEHIIEGLKNKWHIFYTTYMSRKGSAILVKKTLDFEYISDEKDDCGAYVVLKCKVKSQLYTLVSVYNHGTDKKTLDKLSSYLQSMTTGLLVIGGDFNTVLNPFIDKDNSKRVTDTSIHRKLRFCVKKFLKSLQLVDVWRRKNPVNQNYTFNSQVASRLDYFFFPEECMWRVRSCQIRDSGMRDHRPVYLEIGNVLFQKDLHVQLFSQLFNHKKHILTYETGSSLGKESPHALSEVDIVSAVNSLQVSDTPRPDGIPVSFYKDNIQVIIPYIKMIYDRIHSGAFNCSEKLFNETVKSPHDNSQHFFNVDYLVIATILAKRLDDYLESQSKGRVPKDLATVMITPQTFCTEMRLSHIQDEIEKQKRSNPTLYQDFLIVKNLLRDAPEADTESVDDSSERDKLLDQGCPLTPVLIMLALKLFGSALAGHLKQQDILVFKESVILCIQPEDLEKVLAAVMERANEVFYVKELYRGNFNGEQLKCIGNEFKDKDCAEMDAETFVNTEEESKASWTSREDEEDDFVIHKEENISVEGDGRHTMYAVVTLQDSDEVVVAPTNWLSLDKKQCYWPPFKSPDKCMEAVQNRIKTETGGKPWEKLNISFHREHDTFEKAKEGQKETKEQKERSYLLATGFPGILKRQRLESTQGMSNNYLQPLPAVTPASTSRMTADAEKDELLQMLRDIKSTVQENRAMLKKLLKDNTVSEAPSSTSVPSKAIKANLKLPLGTFEDLAMSERELSTATTRKKYVKFLSGLGGFGPKDVIKNIMQQVITDDLAKEFNWQGRGEKRPFSHLSLTDVIRDAAFKRSVNRAECENEIKKYLSYTADRLGRKRLREQGGPGLENPNEISPSLMPETEIPWDILGF